MSTKYISNLDHPTKNHYRVNEFITLKLENDQTNIYVKGKLFNQCKFLLLNIPKSQIPDYNKIESIDDAAERLDRSMEQGGRYQYHINPQTEFWGHCSNLQAWAENEYDTRLLHRNLAFPLLRELTQAGDSKAKKVFKEEIAMRLVSGQPSVVEYLTKEHYLEYLTDVEVQTLSNDLNFLQGVLNNFNIFTKAYVIEQFVAKAPNLLSNLLLISLSRQEYVNYTQSIVYKIKTSPLVNLRKIMSLLIDATDKNEYYIEISDIINLFGCNLILSHLDNVNLNKMFYNPQSPFYEYLLKYERQLFVIESKESLDLSRKALKDLSKLRGLEKFKEVKTLILDNNELSKITGLDVLREVEELSLKFNNLTEITGLEQISTLKILDLQNNKIKELKGIKHLSSLRELNLTNNKIFEIDCEEIPLKVEHLRLENNLIRKITNPSLNNGRNIIFYYQINRFLSVTLEHHIIFININEKPCIKVDKGNIYNKAMIHLHQLENNKIYKTAVYLSQIYGLDKNDEEDSVEYNYLKLCLQLKSWIEHEYDVRLLRKDLAKLLLEQLARYDNSFTIQQAQKELSETFLKADHHPQNLHFFSTNFSEQNLLNSLKGTKIRRKLFSRTDHHESNLLCIIDIFDFNKMELKLIHPLKLAISETLEDYLSIFLKGALVKIKEENPNLTVEYIFYKSTEFIKRIIISNITTMKHYDLIEWKMMELLKAREVSIMDERNKKSVIKKAIITHN